MHVLLAVLLVAHRCDQLIAFAVDVDDLDARVVFQELAQLRDINVHAAGIEVVVVYPDRLQGVVALQYLVGMRAEQVQQLALLCGQLRYLLADGQGLLLCIKHESA